MPGGLIGEQGRVDAAQDDGMAFGPQRIGDPVGPLGRAGDGGDAHQVRLEVQVERLDPLVLDGDLGIQLRGHQGRQRRQRERGVAERGLEDAGPVPMDLPRGGEQLDPHGVLLSPYSIEGFVPGVRDKKQTPCRPRECSAPFSGGLRMTRHTACRSSAIRLGFREGEGKESPVS
jgi:hypothetical protein